jgi:hypothetical protein
MGSYKMKTPIKSFLQKKIDKKKEKEESINLNNLKFNCPVLFHASKIEHAASNIKRGYSKGRTVQRYWTDGRILKDNHKDYEKSGWLHGWSMTRERNYAGVFGDVVFVFDKNKIKNNFKVKTLSWSYRVSGGSGYFKREREDYVIAGKDPRSDKELSKEFEIYQDEMDIQYDLSNVNSQEYTNIWDFRQKDWSNKKLKLDDDIVKGFLVSDLAIENFGKDNDHVKYLLNHKMCMGIYDRKKADVNVEKQPNPIKNNRF